MTRDLASGVRRRTIRLAVDEASPQSHSARPERIPPRLALYPLSAPARRVLRALAEGLCPPAPAPRHPGLMANVVEGAQQLMRHMHPLVARGLAVLLVLLDWAPLIVWRGWQRLHRLPPESIRGVIARLSSSRLPLLRLLASAVRGIIMGVYFDQRVVHDAIGYFPHTHIAERVSLRRALLLEERISAAE